MLVYRISYNIRKVHKAIGNHYDLLGKKSDMKVEAHLDFKIQEPNLLFAQNSFQKPEPP